MKIFKVKIRSAVIGYIIGAAAATALLLSGCGNKEEAEAPVIEQLDENGNVISTSADDADTAETESNTDADGTETEGTEAESPETDSGMTDADVTEADSGMTDAVGTETENTDSTGDSSSEKDYLKYMSDSEIKSLAAEALKNAGKDGGIADGSIMTFGINYDIPEGFEPDPEKDNMYVTKRYPIDASNVRYIELDPDYTMQFMTEDGFKQFLEEAYLNNYGETVSVNVTEFTETEIDGVPAFRIKADYQLEDVHLEHLIIMINGSKTYILDYTQTDEYDRMDLFEASAATIDVRQ